MGKIPFVISLSNSWTVARSALCGVLLIGGEVCFKDLVDKFYVYGKDLTKARETSVSFVSGVADLVEAYISDLDGIKLDESGFNVRDVVKVSSITDEASKISPLGGATLYVYDVSRYTDLKRRCTRKLEVKGPSGRSYFYNFNPKSLSGLQRYTRGASGLGDHSTFIKPLLFYAKVLGCVKNGELTQRLLNGIVKCVRLLEVRCLEKGLFGIIDDVVRQFLSDIDKLTFVICQKNASLSLVYSSLHGLSTMGGPRGWTKESVEKNLVDWVVGERHMPYEDMDHLNKKLDTWFDGWVTGSEKKFLSFNEFVSDPMRWSTGGGAKVSKMDVNGKEVAGRNKWFWALSHLSRGDDIYKVAREEGNDANVALKEETKTRCVITTPQASYLRQCYILYRLGTPTFLRSTLSNPKLVNMLSSSRKDYFICIDSSSFDHSVSKSWIITVLKKLRDRVDPELASLIDEEIDSVSNMSIIFGDRTFKYENGLLSGWRMTSLLGSLLSALVCEHINHRLGIRLEYIVQGDDIIMLCPQPLEQRRVLDCCDEFGIITNAKKTTIGRFGEFLKYRYGYGKVQGYAARAVRSIFYANPWLDSQTISKPDEVANKWWTLLSRLGVTHNGLFKDSDSREWFLNSVVDDVRGWVGNTISRHNIRRCLETPISMGGLGVYETCTIANMSRGSNVVTMSVMEMDTGLIGDERFIELFAKSTIAKVGKVKERAVSVNSIFRSFKDDLNSFRVKYHGVVSNTARTVFDAGSNIFRTLLTEVAKCRSYPPIVDRLLRSTSGPCAVVHRPRFLEKANRWLDLAKWLSGDTLKGVCPPSLFADTRYDSDLVSSLAGVASTMFLNLPNVTAGHSYLMSVFAFYRFRHTRCVLHAL
ncbi:RNA-dependent RNA polymerase [Culex inatomii totivirus]|nr:RNA-dependent RNA polymerase [Culex inatomii totivirus]QTT60749.1 RNA-dependent RNA polymerase [Culex inatomii totivirus]